MLCVSLGIMDVYECKRCKRCKKVKLTSFHEYPGPTHFFRLKRSSSKGCRNVAGRWFSERSAQHLAGKVWLMAPEASKYQLEQPWNPSCDLRLFDLFPDFGQFFQISAVHLFQVFHRGNSRAKGWSMWHIPRADVESV